MKSGANKELENMLLDLPGIGPRQAQRIVYSLLMKSPSFARNLSELISQARHGMRLCQQTFMFFYTDDPSQNYSPIALDKKRNHNQILIVETDSDVRNIEKLDTWQGTYFVLGGSVKASQINNSKKILRLDDLIRIIEAKLRDTETSIEIILGTSASVAGDTTAQLVTEAIKSITDQNQRINITQLGRGLSTGTALEYIDNETLKNALENRH